MTDFTDSPYEVLMRQKPYVRRGRSAEKPPGPQWGKCNGCAYGRSHPCIGVCMKKLLKEVKK